MERLADPSFSARERPVIVVSRPGWKSTGRFWIARACLLLAAVATLSRGMIESRGEDPAVNSPTPLGQFLTLTAPIDDNQFGRVSRVALELQARAQQEKRQGVLVLEIPPGLELRNHQRFCRVNDFGNERKSVSKLKQGVQ